MDAEVKGLRGLDVARGAVIAKRFEICEQLGAGGVGMVFRAIDQDLEEVVALKLLLPHLASDEGVFKRFRNEVLVARSLSHPNIVRTHDIGRAEAGYSYISMEFIDGTSLKEKIQESRETTGRGFVFEEALGIFFHIVSGVAYAHGKGVIHRDIKPANVMIGSSGEVKLADFGTARIVGADTSLTQTGQVIGTPDYMSPEQIRGEALTAACDVYSLGILAYELIIAERPFVAETAVAIAFKHLHDPTPRMSDRAKEVPQWFDDLVQRMTAKRREDRFNSAVDLVAALVEHAPSLSVQSTVFRFDPQAFRRPADGSGSHASSGHERPPESPSLSGSTELDDVTANHKPVDKPASRDGRFELGTPSGAPKPEGEREWRFDMGSDVRDVPSSILPEMPGGRSSALIIGAAILLIPLFLLALIPRVSSGAYDSVQNMIGVKEDQGFFGSFVAGITGVESKSRVDSKPAGRTPGVKSNGQTQTAANTGSEHVGSAATAGLGAQPKGKGDTKSTDQVSTPPTGASSGSEPTKEQLLADLGISNSAGTKSTDSTADTKANEKGDDAGTSAIDLAKSENAAAAGATNPVAPAEAGKLTTSTASTATTQAPPPVEPPQAPAEPFSASLALRENGRTSSGPFPVDRLGSIRWTAEVRGLGSAEKPLTEKEVRAEFSANIFDLKESRVLAKIKVDQVEPGVPGAKPAKLSGSLAQMRGLGVKAGGFRLDLVRSGEVVASSDFSVYRMQVATNEAANGGGQQISIVTDATLPNGGAPPTGTIATVPPPVAPVTPPAVTGTGTGAPATGPSGGTVTSSNLPLSGTSQPGAYAGGINSGGYTPPPTNPAAPYSGGLPPALRGKDEPVPVSNQPVSNQPVVSQPGVAPVGGYAGLTPPAGGNSGPAPAASAPLRYNGTFSVSANDQRPLSLQFTINGTKLSGTAEIGGYGQPFSVEGEVFDRGLSLTLQNGSYWIKLSSGRPERTLRGRYSSPQEQRNGSFEATRID